MRLFAAGHGGLIGAFHDLSCNMPNEVPGGFVEIRPLLEKVSSQSTGHRAIAIQAFGLHPRQIPGDGKTQIARWNPTLS